MRRIILTLAVFSILAITGCKKESLNIINPNEPTVLALQTEVGITNFALGIVNKQLGDVLNSGSTNLFVVALTHHSIMGDELFMPYGNYGARWANQVFSVTPNSTGTEVENPFGITQYQSLLGFNSRQAGDRNAFLYEWFWAYNYVATANQLLAATEEPGLKLSGDANTKKALLKAWALWWKAYAYSRVGSMYIAGLKLNNAGSTNPDYVTNTKMIEEANALLDQCTTILSGITLNDDYKNLYSKITPSYNSPNKIITPDMWKRIINTLKARNLLVNKKTADMTTADWNQVKTLADNGIQSGDNVFQLGMTPDGVNDVSGNFFHPYALLGTNNEFTFVSERLIQDYNTDDARLDQNFTLRSLADRYPPNIRSRGLQFGTRWAVNNIEDGGLYATNNNQGSLAIAGSYEENELMKAEALINTGNIEGGLAIIDDIRDYQSANVDAVAGKGLSLADAKEELRKERRVALFLRGTAFYDARRWGITKPLSQGGGRKNAAVYLPESYFPGNTDVAISLYDETNPSETKVTTSDDNEFVKGQLVNIYGVVDSEGPDPILIGEFVIIDIVSPTEFIIDGTGVGFNNVKDGVVSKSPDVGLGTMDYRYVDYFDVPLNELDFNAPSSIAAPVKN